MSKIFVTDREKNTHELKAEKNFNINGIKLTLAPE